MTTYLLRCTNPVTKKFTEPVTGIATAEEAERLRNRYQSEERPRNGVTLEITVLPEEDA